MEMKKYKLRDLVEIKNGKDHKELKNGFYPVYGSGGIMRYVDEFLYNKPSVLLPRKGTLDNIQYANKPFWTVDTIYYTEIKENLVNAYYLYNYLKQLDLSNLDSGTGVPSMTFESYYNISIQIPSLKIQKKIADVLSSLDDKIALNKKINAKLEAMAKRLYDYWFVQFDFPNSEGNPYKSSGGKMVWNEVLKREIPEGWEVGKIGDVVEIITKGTTPSTAGFNFTKEGVNFVKVECVENGKILAENLMHISEEANESLKRSQLQENDILVTIAGRLGSSAVVSKNILPANTNQAVGIIRLKNDCKFLANYLYERIVSTDVQKHLQGANAQSIQKNLTLPNLADITFVFDKNYKILNAFTEKILPIFNYQLTIQKEIQKLTNLRDRLLPLLINGQVEVDG